MSDPVQSTQDVLGAAGAPPEFVWNGKTYKLGFLTQKAKARFEELICQAETEATKALKGVLSPSEYADAVDRLGRRIHRREFRVGADLWKKYVAGEEAQRGLVLHLLSLFREYHPDMNESTVEAMLDDGPFLQFTASRAVPDFFDYVAAGLKIDPAVMKAKVDEAVSQFLERTRSRG